MFQICLLSSCLPFCTHVLYAFYALPVCFPFACFPIARLCASTFCRMHLCPALQATLLSSTEGLAVTLGLAHGFNHPALQEKQGAQEGQAEQGGHGGTASGCINSFRFNPPAAVALPPAVIQLPVSEHTLPKNCDVV